MVYPFILLLLKDILKFAYVSQFLFFKFKTLDKLQFY